MNISKLKRLRGIIMLVLVYLVLPSLATSQDSGRGSAGEESWESGFSDEEPVYEETATPIVGDDDLVELRGFLRLDSSYNYAHEAPDIGETDFRGLSKLRGTLQLDFSLTLPHGWKGFLSGQGYYDGVYGIKGRDQYTDEVLEGHEQQVEFREVWVRGSPLDSLDLKIGRQIMVWGKSDFIRVVDILNPVDNREPGLVDLEDLRLPISMSRIDYYFGDWGLTALAIHEVRFNKNPAIGSDFNPGTEIPPEVIPDHGGKNTEFGLALNGALSGWDISFYWAEYFEDEAHAEFSTAESNSGSIQLVHSKLTMAGAAVNFAIGNWLLRGETARFDGLKYFSLPDRTYSRYDFLLGLEYSGIQNSTITIETADRHLIDFDKTLEEAPISESEDIIQFVVSYRRTFFREKMKIVALDNRFGKALDEGGVQRISVAYDFYDSLTVTGGFLIFQSGSNENPVFESIQDNDRLFASARYSF